MKFFGVTLPGWAKFAAIDFDGTVIACEDEPKIEHGCWQCDGADIGMVPPMMFWENTVARVAL